MADELVSERRYSSRKFLMACSIIVAGHIALGLSAINSAEWLDLMKWIAGLYFAGNVGTWAVDAIKGRAP